MVHRYYAGRSAGHASRSLARMDRQRGAWGLLRDARSTAPFTESDSKAVAGRRPWRQPGGDRRVGEPEGVLLSCAIYRSHYRRPCPGVLTTEPTCGIFLLRSPTAVGVLQNIVPLELHQIRYGALLAFHLLRRS